MIHSKVANGRFCGILFLYIPLEGVGSSPMQIRMVNFKHFRLAALLIAGFFGCLSAKAVNPKYLISQYAHTAWRLQDGYLGTASLTVTQTKDGFIWIGTTSGIKRFDGVEFNNWTPVGGEQLWTAPVSELLGTSDGSLWIGTEGRGVWWYKDGRLRRIPLDEGTGGATYSILEGDRGSIWLSVMTESWGSVCQVASGNPHCYGEADGLPHYCCEYMAKDAAGSLWVTGSVGAIKWNPRAGPSSSHLFQYPLRDTTDAHIVALTADHGAVVGSLRLGIGGGLQYFKDGVWSPFVAKGFAGNAVATSALLLDRHDALWIGTASNGIYKVHDGRADHYGVEDGLSGGMIQNFYEDHEGNMWVATTKGLDCFRDVAVSTLSTREGLSSKQVESLLVSKDGTIWAGGVDGLDAIRNGDVTSFRAGRGLPGHQITALAEDRKGRLLVGIDTGLTTLLNGKFHPIERPDHSSVGMIVGMSPGVGDDVWAEASGSRRELLHLEDLRVKEVLASAKAPPARRVAIDASGDLWLGLRTGDLARRHGGDWTTFKFPHSENPPLVNELLLSRDRAVFGATNSGLVGWRLGKQRMMTMRDGLPCDGINTLLEDRHAALWLYMQCGLAQISNEELQAWWNSANYRVHVRLFDALDGVQPGTSPFRASARGLDGRLWFANGSALQVIDPEHLRTNDIPPPVQIEDVIVRGNSLAPANGTTLPPETRDVAIRYTALSFVAPARVLFRYKLEGQDTTWQDAGRRREASYTNLRPGPYNFRVIACNNEGIWNEVGDSFSFRIVPAYYQTTWFATLCCVALVCALSLLYLLRIRQAKAQFVQTLGARLEERERISRELHDTLLQGFQGLMLRFHSVLKVLPEGQPGRQMLENVLDRADEVLLEGRQSVRDLRVGRSVEQLPELISRCGHELEQSYGILFSLDVVGNVYAINVEVTDEAFRIVREAIFNAFQHSRGTKIEAEVTYGRFEVKVNVRDNGVGMSAELVAAGRPDHWGLKGMRERAQRLSSKLDIWSTQGAGTEVELKILSGVVPHSQVKYASLWSKLHNDVKK